MIACYQDYRSDKIKNWLIVCGMLWGLYIQWLDYGYEGIFLFVAGILGTYIFAYPFFKLGVLGAGDVKLFMVCIGIWGIREGVQFLCCTFLTAAVFSFLKMLYYHSFIQRFRYFISYMKNAFQTERFTLYEQKDKTELTSRIHLAGPALVAFTIFLGGKI